jgi:hypothetical protein
LKIPDLKKRAVPPESETVDNYHYADWAYKRYGMQWAMEDGFFSQKGEELRTAFESEGIPCQMVF